MPADPEQQQLHTFIQPEEEEESSGEEDARGTVRSVILIPQGQSKSPQTFLQVLVTKTSSDWFLCQLYHHIFSDFPLPPQLFVELNELIVDKDHEMSWKERARWIKFEEDVEEETDRWGKPHVASLSFRSLLELRRTITHGRRNKTRKKKKKTNS